MRRSLPLLVTLAAEAGAVVLLYRLIREPGFAIPIALGCAAWLLSSTLLYLGASLARVPTAIRAAGRVTLPALRRRVDRALAASILTGALVAGATPALAASPPSPDPVVDASGAPLESDAPPDAPETPDAVVDEIAPTLPVRTGRTGDPAAIVTDVTTQELPLPDGPALTPAPTTLPIPDGPAPTSAEPTPDRDRVPASTPAAPPQPTGPAPIAVPDTAATSYTVVPGDNFWEIAARHLAAVTGRDRAALTDGEILQYWVRVCDANRDRIRSGDVNLIDPGEVVELPPV